MASNHNRASGSKHNQTPHSPESVVIGVAGLGVVGSVVFSYFQKAGFRVTAFDKYKRVGSLAQLDAAAIVFVCVPTPYSARKGLSCAAIEELILGLRTPKTVVVKSTVLPGSTFALARQFPQHTLLFNPEFLREKTAERDFLEPDRQIVGYCPGGESAATEVLALLPRAPFEAVMPALDAEIIKVATNAFLALKVTFANEMYDLCQALGADYERLRAGLYADQRIGASHFDVFDGGYRGFGGKCLPKDSQALLDLAERLGSGLELLRAAHLVNQRLLNEADVRLKAAG